MVPVQFLGEEVLATAPPYPTWAQTNGGPSVFWTRPTCPACGYAGPPFMYLPHGSWSFHVLVQDRHSLALRVVEIPNGGEVLRALDDVPEPDRDRVWAARVAELAGPLLGPTERIVPTSELMEAAVQPVPTAAGLCCPGCRSRLYWQATGIS
jgi:hypothetical protein